MTAIFSLVTVAFGAQPAGAKDLLWEVGISPGVTLNAKTDFDGYGGFTLASVPPAPGGGPSFAVYDDGYVLADISGDPTLTTNWGYSTTSQYNPGGGGSIALSAVSGVGTAGVDEDADAAPGLEISVLRRLPELSGERVRLSLEVALGFSEFDSENASALSADLN
ncbi:MAG TPA: hypothetical protein VJ952_11575, partial [Opitutales bacterium]|nr:hypothetical protein [Opitutales bacterium]